jgi:hypothetical protein
MVVNLSLFKNIEVINNLESVLQQISNFCNVANRFVGKSSFRTEAKFADKSVCGQKQYGFLNRELSIHWLSEVFKLRFLITTISFFQTKPKNYSYIRFVNTEIRTYKCLVENSYFGHANCKSARAGECH